MSNSHIITVFSKHIAPKESESTVYLLPAEIKNITGILISGHASISMAFGGNQQLIINKFNHKENAAIAPSDKIIPCNYKVENEPFISVKVSNLSDAPENLHIYLFTKKIPK